MEFPAQGQIVNNNLITLIKNDISQDRGERTLGGGGVECDCEQCQVRRESPASGEREPQSQLVQSDIIIQFYNYIKHLL